ncbi:MAG: chemotaxis protein CheW [Candidatus Promineifilaceae bacterium]
MSEDVQSHTYILFDLAGTKYGVNSQYVQQLEMVNTFTTVPNAPSFIEGIAFLRGQVVPVMNLRVRFGLEKRPFDQRTRLIVVKDEARTVGFIVDSAREFISIAEEAVQPPPEFVAGMSSQYLHGVATVGEQVILLLNVTKVLQSVEEIKVEITPELTTNGKNSAEVVHTH